MAVEQHEHPFLEHYQEARKIAQNNTILRLICTAYNEYILPENELKVAVIDDETGQEKILHNSEECFNYLYTRDPLHPISIMMPCGESNIKISDAADLWEFLKPYAKRKLRDEFNEDSWQMASYGINYSLNSEALSVAKQMEFKRQVQEKIPDFPTTWGWLTSQVKSGNEFDTLITQVGAFTGNPQHPLAKMRKKIRLNQEFSMEELTAYFAEFGNQFALPIAAVSKHHLDTFAMPSQKPYDAFFSSHYPEAHHQWETELRALSKEPSEYTPVPVHPLNILHMQETLKEWVHSGEIILTGAAIQVAPTISTRSVRPVENHAPNIKLTLPDVQLTSQTRHLGRSSVCIAPTLTHWVQGAVEQNNGFDDCLRVIGEPYGACFNHDKTLSFEQQKEGDKHTARAISVLYRENPNTALHKDEYLVPLAACFYSIGKSEAGNLNKPLIADIMRTAGVQDAQTAQDYFRRYAHTVISGQLGLFARYGIALEPHQQNSFGAFDKSGNLKAAVVQDLADGVQIYKPVFDMAASPLGENVAERYIPNSFFSYTFPETMEKPLEQIMHTTFKTHLFPMAAIINQEFGVSKHDMLQIMKDEIASTLKHARDEHLIKVPEIHQEEYLNYLGQIEDRLLKKPILNRVFLTTFITQKPSAAPGERPNPFF